MERNWIRIERVRIESKIVDRVDTFSRALFTRRGVQVAYRHKYDWLDLFERTEPIVWAEWQEEFLEGTRA